MAQLSTKGVVFGTFCGIASAIFLSGCSGSGQGFNSNTTTTNTLLGTWTRTALSVDGTSITCPNSLSVNSIVVDSCVAGETIQFNSDGTYALSDPATKFGAVYSEAGTYSLSGTTLTLTRLQTDVIAGVVTPGTLVNLPAPVVVPNTIFISATTGFTLQPKVPISGASYTVPEATDGMTVVSTYVKD